VSDNAIRRLLGAFYTPSSAADFMADWILRHDNQSLLEPSFGDGIFLRAIKLSDLRKGFSNTALFGVEIDATVHERAICEQLQTPVLEPKANMDTHAGNREVIRDAEGTPHSRQALLCVTCRGS